MRFIACNHHNIPGLKRKKSLTYLKNSLPFETAADLQSVM